MNVTTASPVDSSAQAPHAPALEADLIAKAATIRIQNGLKKTVNEPVLFAVFDFSEARTSDIVRAIVKAEPTALIGIHPDLVSGPIPQDWVSQEPVAYWRNLLRSKDHRAIVCAVPTSALDTVGETAATVHRVSPEHLKADLDAWFTASQHIPNQSDRHQRYLRHAIEGLLKTDIATSVEAFARFIQRLDECCDVELVHKALNRALSELRMPPGSAKFPPPGDRGRLTSSEAWAVQLNELYNQVSDVAYLRTDKGVPLDRAVIRARVEELMAAGELDEDAAQRIEALLDDPDIEPGVWTPSQQNFVELDWNTIQKVVRVRRTVKQERLSKSTLDFFEREFQGLLTNVEQDLLERLDESRSADPTETAFYSRFGDKLLLDKKLRKRWDQFVFRVVRNHADLMSGIVHAAFDLTQSANVQGKILYYRLDKAMELEFWRRHLLRASEYLRDRYRGLAQSLPASIKLDFGICWSRDWADEIEALETHTGKIAEYRFDVYLLDPADFESSGTPKAGALDSAPKTQMIWSPPIQGFGLSYPEHLRAIAVGNSPLEVQLLSGRFSRTTKNTVSATVSLKISDRRTIDDLNDQDEGQLFDANDISANHAAAFKAALAKLTRDGVVSPSGRDAIEVAFDAFSASYGAAVLGFKSGLGAHDDSVVEQGRLYGLLLLALRTHADRDACRRPLWVSILQIGMAISRNAPGALVTPFAPLRLAEIGLKARWLGVALTTILESPDDLGLRAFVNSAVADLERSWFTDFAVVTAGESPTRVMLESQFLDDYSFVEPAADQTTARDEQGAFTRQAAENLMKVLSEHLDLHPHNTANFSVVLYNSESRDLPSAVAERLSRRVDEDQTLRCDLIIANDDRRRLRQIYAEQNVAIGRELETSGAADLTKEFLSNLRVGIGDIEKLSTADADNKPLDVAFLQDVFARNAKTRWRRCAQGAKTEPDFGIANRRAPSRRQVHGAGENKTRVLLASPTRPMALQHYLDLAMELTSGEAEDPDRRDHWEPVREITFDNNENTRIIARAHAIADWVVTFDAIADRQLFHKNGISVIRSVPIDEARHNLVVSTNAHRKSLTKRIASMVAEVTGDTALAETELARKLIARAANISGQIVLRAANRDKAAQELIGLTLSEQLVRSSLQGQQPLAWFFLDDFKTRFGHLTNDTVADILLVTAEKQDDALVIGLKVIEAKYVEDAGLDKARDKSRQQVETSLMRLMERYGPNRNQLNAASWSALLADLVVEHGNFEDRQDGATLQAYVDAIRENGVRYDVSGYSLVFLHDREKDAPPTSFDDAFSQFFFNRPTIATLLGDIRSSQGSQPLAAAPATSRPDDLDAGTVIANDAPPTSSPMDDGAADVAGPTVDAVQQLPVELNASPNGDEGVAIEEGAFPPALAHLIASRSVPASQTSGQAWREATVAKLKNALKGYNMTCEVLGSRLTPNAALVRFRGNDSMTVDLVQKRIGTLLTSHGLEIIAVRPAKGEVIVMVARDDRVILPTLDIWRRRALPPSSPNSNTSFILGEREDTGEILYLNLAGSFAGQPQHAPHTLIAGESGGGKGVFTANLLLDICATNSPDSARIQLVDPKAGIDYAWIEHVPHLDGGIITTPEEATVALEALVAEMERRYSEVLAANKVPNIDVYNAKVSASERLPRIYFFHDELADWMDDSIGYLDVVGTYVKRLSAKARAAGIHLFIITQRPDKDALPGAIKANIGNKIALKVSNRLNSQIILDETGAEALLGHGHMIAKLANQPGGLVYAQAPYLSTEEAHAAATAIGMG